MSKKTWGAVLLLIGSETLGLLAAEWFYRLFLKTVPPLALSSFNQGAAHIGFLFYGAVTGLAVFGWSLLAATLWPLFRAADQATQ